MEKLEGTFAIEGLIEGAIPNLPDAETILRNWVTEAAADNLRFNLELDGGRFSLLAAGGAMAVAGLGSDPAMKVSEHLDQLCSRFPIDPNAPLFSTLRSVEYQPGKELQALYLVRYDGRVDMRQRTVDAVTRTLTAGGRRPERVRLVLTGLVIAALAFGISAFFVDYRALARNLWKQAKPLSASDVEVRVDAVLENYFTVEKKSVGRDGRTLVLALKRKQAFPLTDAALSRAMSNAPSTADRLALTALARGYLRCEYFDDKDTFAGQWEFRIKGLRKNESAEVSLPVPHKWRVAHMRLTY